MAGVIGGSEYSPGTYNIDKIEINGDDVKWMLIELNLYEDLLSPCITGDVSIIDTHNLLANTPFLEGDQINISLKCNNDDKMQSSVDGGSIDGMFEIIKIMNRVKTKDNQQMYTLKFASAGWSTNVRTRISRSYTQQPYSQIVQDIFDSKFMSPAGLRGGLKAKSLKVEDTEGSFNVIIPRWKPLTCFSWLAGRSRSQSACNWLFWEDKDEFHYESVESLMSKDSVATYTVAVKNREKVSEQDYFAVSNYEYMDTGEILYYGLNGMFGNRLLIHDILNKKQFDYFPTGQEADNFILKDEYDYQEMFEELSHTGDGGPLVESDITDSFASDPGNARLTVINKHFKQWDETTDFEYDKWLRQRIAQKQIIKYLKIRVWAIGNFTRKVGDIITFNIPSPEAENTSEKDDPRLKGEYLVTALRHKFDTDKHVIVMELIKDCIAEG